MLMNHERLSYFKQGIESALDDLLTEFLNNSVISNQVPSLSSIVSEFASRKGKRIRPLMFTYAYYSAREEIPEYLFHTAASIELLHLFALIHDDVVDKSDTRSGSQSLHKLLENHFKIESHQSQNLAVIIGDSLFSFAISSFLKVSENSVCKQSALKKILDAATKTGFGQFLELMHSQKSLGCLSKEDILEIYDYKTSMYTFCGPLAAGARLANVSESEINKLYQAGSLLGRAYQIQDDLCETIESLSAHKLPSDIIENRKTVLLWHLYQNSTNNVKSIIDSNTIHKFNTYELSEMFNAANTFLYTKEQINTLLDKAFSTLDDIDYLKSVHKELKSFLNSLFPHYR